MAGLHCSDCIFSEFNQNEQTKRYAGSCSRGYTLENPHAQGDDAHWADSPDQLVPTINPYGEEYLRTSNVCGEFRLPNRKVK